MLHPDPRDGGGAPLRRGLLQQLDKAAADHDGVRHLGHRARRRGVADAETDPDGKRHARLDGRDFTRNAGNIQICGARHPLERHIVDVAARHLADGGDPVVGRRRREQEDRIDARRAHLRGEIVRFLGRIVDDEHAVDARVARGRGECVRAHALDRIRVAHQHDGRLLVARAKALHVVEHAVKRHAFRERALRRALDHGAVGHRVGERHAELDHVGAAFGERVHQLDGLRRVRVSRGDERNQPLATLGGECGKSVLNTGHGFFFQIVRYRARRAAYASAGAETAASDATRSRAIAQ